MPYEISAQLIPDIFVFCATKMSNFNSFFPEVPIPFLFMAALLTIRDIFIIMIRIDQVRSLRVCKFDLREAVMEDWLQERIRLGRTELYAGRLGFGASYGAPAAAWELGFEAGCNYFYWGALRNKKMTLAMRNIIAQGKRDAMIIVVQDFRRSGKGLEKSLMRGLKPLGTDYADVLLLGWYNKHPKPQVLEAAEKLRAQGAFRYLAISGHNRSIFPEWAQDPNYGVLQLRYNAANRGAEDDVFPLLPEKRPGMVVFNANRHMSLVNSKKIPQQEKRPTSGDCYRYVLSHPAVDVAISAPSKLAQMEENLREVAKGPMSAEEMDWMRRIGDYVYGRKSI